MSAKGILEMSRQELRDLLIKGNVIIKPSYSKASDYNHYTNIAQDETLGKHMGIGIKAYIEDNMDCICETHTITIEDVEKFLKDYYG